MMRWFPVTLALVAVPLTASAQAHDYKHAPTPYSIPFQLRPAAVPNAVRLDNSVAFHDANPGSESHHTIASLITGALRITPELGAIARIGVVSTGDATVLTNPAVGGNYLIKLSDELRLSLFLGVAAPLGQGGGSEPNLVKAGAIGAGVLARAAFDNALFAPNYLTVFPGVDLAYVANNLTVQAEATVFQLIKARGPEALESARTNFTTGLHVGYFVIPELSLGAELRYQRFLKNQALEGKPGNDNLTFAAGVRGHFQLSDKRWFRPGLAYSRGLDAPMTDLHYNIVQLDLLFIF